MFKIVKKLKKLICKLRGHKWRRQWLLGSAKAPVEMDTYCVRCGVNMLDWIKKTDLKRFLKIQSDFSKSVEQKKQLKKSIEKQAIQKGRTANIVVINEVATVSQKEHLSIQEFQEKAARERWLPKSTVRRRTIRSKSSPPAERHRGAITKAMRGKGGKKLKGYRQTIKGSKHIKIEEGD